MIQPCKARKWWVRKSYFLNIFPSFLEKAINHELMPFLSLIFSSSFFRIIDQYGFIRNPNNLTYYVLFIPGSVVWNWKLWNHTSQGWFWACQWETSLQSNAISHWLGANLESALYLDQHYIWRQQAITCSYIDSSPKQSSLKKKSSFSLPGLWWSSVNQSRCQVWRWATLNSFLLFPRPSSYNSVTGNEDQIFWDNRMAWQWAETLVEIREL